jgi:outer membrane murein-binding lipoprotein Lpp
MIQGMKTLALCAVLLSSLILAGCEDRDCEKCENCEQKSGQAHMQASSEAEKSFDKENPANPGALK